MAEKSKTIGIVGPVRLSYLNVFRPRKNGLKNDELEYSATLLIPKAPNQFCPDPKAVGSSLTEIIKNAAAEKFGEGAKGWRSPLKDGDTDLGEDGAPKNPGYYTVRCSCKADFPPVLIDGARNHVTSGFESGDWGKVKLSAWTYDTSGNKGISVGLRAVQFLYKDEPLGQSSDPTAIANEFEEVPGAVLAAAIAGAVSDEYDPFADV